MSNRHLSTLNGDGFTCRSLLSTVGEDKPCNCYESELDELIEQLEQNVKTAVELDENLDYHTNDTKNKIKALVLDAEIRGFEKARKIVTDSFKEQS